MKKLILFVDDDQFRHEVFIESVLGQDINTDHAFDVLEAIDFLEKEKHDEVWLDHDFDKTDSTRNGFDLALWMTSHMDPIPVVIHSMNPDGAKRMQDLFFKHGWDVEVKPFLNAVQNKGRCRICGWVGEGIKELCIECGESHD